MNRYGYRSTFLNRLDRDTYLFHLDIEIDILFIYVNGKEYMGK